MSSGFGVPALDFSPLARLGQTFERRAIEERQRELSRGVGVALQSGDYAGAAARAFDAGDAQAGLGLLKLGESFRKDQLGAKAAADFAASLGGGFGGDDGGGFSPSAGQRRLGGELPSFADQGLPSSGYVASLFKRESGGNPNARASTSSATGLGQFTDRTWAGVARQHPDLGLTPDGRTDPQQMLRATQAHTADNAELLRRSNLPVNDASLYSLHFLGGGGGRRFVAGTMADPDRPATAYVSPEQVAANRNVFFDRSGRARTAGEVFGSFERFFGGRGGGTPTRTASADGSLFAQDLPGAPGLDQPAPQPGIPTPLARRPAQYASLPSPDAPVQGMNPEAPRLAPSPNPVPSANSDGRLTTGAERPGLPALPTSPSIGGSDPSRTMTMPGAEPTQVAQAGGGVPAVADRREAVAMRQVRAIPNSGAGLSQRMQGYARAISDPNLPDGPRELAKQLLGEELQRTRLPDNVKAFLWARGNGLTQARSLGEFEQEGKGSGFTSLNGRLIYTDKSTGTARDATPEGMPPTWRPLTPQERQSLGVKDDAAVYMTPEGPKSLSGQTINVGGAERAQDVAIGTDYGKRFVEMQRGASSARSTSVTIDAMERAMNSPGFYSGTGGQARLAFNRALQSAGITDKNSAAPAEVFEALSNRLILDGLGGSLGTGISNGDRDFIQRTAPTLTNTIEGNRELLRIARSLTQRQEQVAKLARNYASANGGRLDMGFDEKLAEWAEANPLTPGGSGTAAPAGGQREAPAVQTGGVPAAAAQHLRANPNLRGDFDAKYGAGASDAVLGPERRGGAGLDPSLGLQ